MTTSSTCPLCAAERIEKGWLLLAGGFSEGLRLVLPRHRESFLFRSFSVDLPSTFHACTACGFLWSFLAPRQLEKIAAVRNQMAVTNHPADCPCCKCNGVLGGSVFHPDAISSNPFFLPSVVSRFRLRFDFGVELQSNLNSCFDCGLVIGQISTAELSAFSLRYAFASEFF